MLLSEWGSEAPSSGCMNQAVLDALGPVLSDMGAGGDPECWVAWGDDPEFKYSVLAPTAAGLVTVAVRLNPGGDGRPRATAKLVRWSKLQIGEFAIEAGDDHRVVAVQVEGLVLKGTDEQAGRICEFVRGLIAGADGRALAGSPVLQAVPVAAAAAVRAAPAAPAVPAAPAAPAAKPAKAARADAQPGGEPVPAGKGAARKPAKAAKPEEEEEEAAWVSPHPIAVPDEPVAATPPPVPEPAPVQPAPVQPAPVQPAPGFGPGATRESGSVWEVPAVDPSTRDQKKPRTWRP